MPKTIRFRIRSLMIMAESTSTIMGVETIITDAEIGEVRLNPLKKESMFKATPKKAAQIILGKSARSILSLRTFSGIRVKSQTNQNKIVEPPTRIKINP